MRSGNENFLFRGKVAEFFKDLAERKCDIFKIERVARDFEIYDQDQNNSNGNINEEDEDTQSVFSFNFLQEDSQNKLSLPDYNLP